MPDALEHFARGARRLRQHGSRLAAGAARLFVESLLIMLNVLMGFGVNEYRERKKSVQAANDVVIGFRTERGRRSCPRPTSFSATSS